MSGDHFKVLGDSSSMERWNKIGKMLMTLEDETDKLLNTTSETNEINKLASWI